MSKVYSYVRFSSKAQEFGDSQRRQFTRAQEYCRKNGLTLETTTFEDLGVSAWRGRNVDKGRSCARDDRHAQHPSVRTVALAVRLARHTAQGWANPAIPDDVQELAALLNLSEAATQLLLDGI